MKFTLILATAILILASCNSPKKKNSTWEFKTESITDETKNMTQTIQYPVFKSDFVNGVVNKEVSKMSQQFKSEIGTELISENWKNEQNISVEIFTSENGHLSLLFYNYLFTGGAHGNTMLKSFVFDPDGKEVIDLAYVLKGGYFDKLQDLTRKQLKAKLGYEGFVDEGTETLSDFSVFILSSDSIIFYFPQYQVASYADGIQKVSFALSELQKTEDLK